MAQYIKNADIFGRLGSGIGQGLSEQLPKEIERGRLAQGLQQLEQEKGLTPFQQFTRLAPLAYDKPAVLQGATDILNRQSQNEALRNIYGKEGKSTQQPADILKNAVNQQNGSSNQEAGVGQKKTPTGYVEQRGTQAALHNYIPKNQEQLVARGSELSQQYPGLHQDAQGYLNMAAQEDQQAQAISKAYQGERESQRGVANTIKEDIQKLKEAANASIPENVYQQVENDTLEKIKNGELKEDAAAKHAQEKIDKISREYDSLERLGKFSAFSGKYKDLKRKIDTTRDSFKKRDDLPNMKQTLMGVNGLSDPYATFLTFENSDVPGLEEEFKKIAPNQKKYFPGQPKYINDPVEATNKIAPKFAKFVKENKNAHPLSIGVELASRGLDMSTWLSYLKDHESELGLTDVQKDEVGYAESGLPNMHDIWLFYGSGLQKYLE